MRNLRKVLTIFSSLILLGIAIWGMYRESAFVVTIFITVLPILFLANLILYLVLRKLNDNALAKFEEEQKLAFLNNSYCSNNFLKRLSEFRKMHYSNLTQEQKTRLDNLLVFSEIPY